MVIVKVLSIVSKLLHDSAATPIMPFSGRNLVKAGLVCGLQLQVTLPNLQKQELWQESINRCFYTRVPFW